MRPPFGSILSYFILLVNILPDKMLYYGCEVIKLNPLKEKISITLDGDLLKKIREKAAEDDRSVSQYINLILKKYIEKEQTQ